MSQEHYESRLFRGVYYFVKLELCIVVSSPTPWPPFMPNITYFFSYFCAHLDALVGGTYTLVCETHNSYLDPITTHNVQSILVHVFKHIYLYNYMHLCCVLCAKKLFFILVFIVTYIYNYELKKVLILYVVLLNHSNVFLPYNIYLYVLVSYQCGA